MSGSDEIELPSKGSGFWVFLLPRDVNLMDHPMETFGKWMLFFPNNEMDTAWTTAVHAFNNNKLGDVSGMKASTFAHNPRALDNTTGTIILYCGGNQSSIESTGEAILEAMQYRAMPSRFKPYIYYKSNDQTAAGTAATGCKNNWLYRIPCLSRGCANPNSAEGG
jgi:hypothetical protein